MSAGRRRTVRRRGAGRFAALLSWYAYVLLMGIFIFLPMVILVVFSLNAARYPRFPLSGFTLAWYSRLLADDLLLQALLNSVIVGAVTSVAALLLGGAAAYSLARRGAGEGSAARTFLALPMIVPYTIIALGFLLFFRAVGVPTSLWATIVAHTTLFLPIPFLVLYGQLRRYDFVLERAAADLGANRFRTLLHVTVPLLAPAILGSSLLTLALSWDEFVVAYFTSGFEPTLPVRIWTMITRSGLNPTINAVGTLVLFVSLALALGGLVAVRSGRIARSDDDGSAL